MGAKSSRRKSDGAEAPSEQKHNDPEVDTMPTEEAPHITQATISEDDVQNKSMETVQAKLASVSVEDPTEPVTAVSDTEAKHDSLTSASQEAPTKIELSIPESPADSVSIPHEPLATEEQRIPEAPEHGPEATVRDAEALAEVNDAVSGQEVPETEELLVCVDQGHTLLPAEHDLNQQN
ncbi:uncharacterized protein Hap1MRO34_008586 [Clarias gariepinus]